MMGMRRSLLSALLAVIAGMSVTVVCLVVPERLPATVPSQEDTPTSRAPDPDPPAAHLYFADKSNTFLTAEERALTRSDDPAETGRMIIETLIRGPNKGHMRTIPPDAALRALFVTADGTALVDMTSAIKEKHPGGAESELMTIFSIVNSLMLNVPEIDSVKILINGRESETLAGHVDLRFPFQANMLMIR
jgi:spore germination protein GerM